MLEIDVGTPGEIRSLLKENGVGAEDLAHIYCDFLGESWKYAERQERNKFTSFWAEKMEFMTGM